MITVLYIGVHSHKSWGAEYWVSKAFDDINIITIKIDYRKEFKKLDFKQINKVILSKINKCNLIFLQRGDNLNPKVFIDIKIPIIFWSTEPIQLKNDVDQLLKADIFSWVYVHSYSCLERIKNEFNHLESKTSVMHNAAPKEKIKFKNDIKLFSIFNRSLSYRRRLWLFFSKNMVKIIKGHYGEEYFQDLRSSEIAINIHYSRKNLDDFESGIFEAMASGCVIISETLNIQTLMDLNMESAIIQVNSPRELMEKLQYLKSNPQIIKYYRIQNKVTISKNTWHDRASKMKIKFEEVCNQ